MTDYFKIYFEFDKDIVKEKIEHSLNRGRARYICVVDSNVLTMAFKSKSYCSILNNSLFCVCDGSSIVFFIRLIYGHKYNVFNGPDLFKSLLSFPGKRHVILGNSIEIHELVKKKIESTGLDIGKFHFYPLPFLDVSDFDYNAISDYLNDISPDFIWVSLGAPKQEIFMQNIEPFLKRGLLVGIGAGINFYVGNIPTNDFSIFGLRFLWFNRLLNEPRKMLRRHLKFIFMVPKIVFTEILERKKM